ncbi:regulator of chromosome condensation 1/beta-lactamase-inhibitor protein II [Helicostylum pulchrum]|nr:regulator of chromosome condensation 1/beta-lactamase-inhibitor protein II [Helicostylum pulchrum]
MLSKLPRDILLQDILILLDSKSLINLSLASTYFNYLVNNDQHIWKRLCFQEFNISQDNAFRNKGWKQLYVALLTDTKVFTWGENSDDRLGLTPTVTPDAFQFNIRNPRRRYSRTVTTPQEVAYLQDKGIIDITSGGWSFHALDSSGSVWMWGTMHQEISPRSSAGTRRLTTPTKIQETNNTTQPKIKFRSISCGRTHVIGLARDGTVWHWTNHLMLQRVQLDLEPNETIVQVVANWSYSTVLTNEGAIYVIPSPDLIIPSQVTVEPTPTSIVTPKVPMDIVQIAGLDGYTLALTKDGRVLKLNTRNHIEFSANPELYTIELVHFSAKKPEFNYRDGSMNRFITGAFLNFAVYTKSGQVLLGKVDAEVDTEPTMLPELQNRDVCKVSFGDYHFGALTNQGELLTWGAYSSGALGHGPEDEHDEPEPRLVESMKDMFTFAIGFGGWQSSVLAIPTYNDHA